MKEAVSSINCNLTIKTICGILLMVGERNNPKKGDIKMAQKVWTKEEIRDLIEKNDEMVKRSVIKLYQYQTEYEKEIKSTEEDNGVGFNGLDANIMSSFAEFALKSGFLTPKQIKIARNKLKKYAGQLARIANGKI